MKKNQMNLYKQPALVNILITDYCNQSCSFCFARQEMKMASKKEMSMKSYKMILEKCANAGVRRIVLAGGEPTIHSQFSEMLTHTINSNFMVNINTNGIYSDEVEHAILSGGYRTVVYLNISTPGFISNSKIRKMILERINRLVGKIKVVLIVTNQFLMPQPAMRNIDLIGDELLSKVSVRIGVEGSVAGEKNYTTLDQFPLIGNNFFKTYQYLARNSPQKILFSKSITPCMFSQIQRKKLIEDGYMQIFHCHPENENVWFSINCDLTTFMCYPLSTRDRKSINNETSFEEIRDYYKKLQLEYDHKYTLPECKSCPFFGLTLGKCPGPCASFRVNTMDKLKINSERLIS